MTDRPSEQAVNVKRWWHFLWRPKKHRVDLQFVPYDKAQPLLDAGYTIAREEDENRMIGWVYLEKREQP